MSPVVTQIRKESLIERECQKGNIKPKADPVEIKYEPRKLFGVHAKAMIMLMGGEI